MKQLKTFGLAAVAALALTACLGAGGASATTLEIGGAAQNSSVTFTMSLDPGTSSVTALTGGSLANTCTASHVHGATSSPFTGTRVTGPISTLTFTSCERPVIVHKAGQLYVEHIAGTTDGTVFWENGEVTEGSPIGTLTCKSGVGTDIGRLTGATTGSNPSQHATLDVAAVLNCGFLAPSALWIASYIVTSPTELGVVS